MLYTSLWISTHYITTVDCIKFGELWLKCQVLGWMNCSRHPWIWTTRDGWIRSFQKHSQHTSRLEPPSGEWQRTRWEKHQKTIHQTFFWWQNEGQRIAREFTRRARKWHQYASIDPRGTRLDGEWPWRDPQVWRILEVVPGVCESQGRAALHCCCQPQLC